MILAAHQPHYLPWLRYFHKMASSEVFVLLDDLQFNKNGWQNRNKIKTALGELVLTVPVIHKFQQPLSDVQIDSKQPWARKHWRTLETNYRKAPHFKEHAPFFRDVFERPWERLNDLNCEILFYLVGVLGIKAKIVRSSGLSLKAEGTDRLVEICKTVGAKTYLTGAYAAGVYLNTERFKREGIELVFQEFECPRYPQLFPETGFIPELSIVDLLFNCSPKSLEILQGRFSQTSSAGRTVPDNR